MAQQIQLTYGSSSSVDVGSRNCYVVSARHGRPFYAKVTYYVCVLVALAPLVCAHVFVFVIRTRMTQPHTQRTPGAASVAIATAVRPNRQR